MAYALEGSVGAAVTGGTGASVTPSWGTGESRTTGHLLILWVAATSNATVGIPAAPSGWTLAKEVDDGANVCATIFYRIASGADAAPTVAPPSSSTRMAAQLAEFSGNTSTPLDQAGGTIGNSPNVATAAATDATAGELLVSASAIDYFSGTANPAGADTFNNGATANSSNNNAATDPRHYSFAYGITTGNAAADSNSYAFSLTNWSDTATVVASFLVSVPGGPPSGAAQLTLGPLPVQRWQQPPPLWGPGAPLPTFPSPIPPHFPGWRTLAPMASLRWQQPPPLYAPATTAPAAATPTGLWFESLGLAPWSPMPWLRWGQQELVTFTPTAPPFGPAPPTLPGQRSWAAMPSMRWQIPPAQFPPAVAVGVASGPALGFLGLRPWARLPIMRWQQPFALFLQGAPRASIVDRGPAIQGTDLDPIRATDSAAIMAADVEVIRGIPR